MDLTITRGRTSTFRCTLYLNGTATAPGGSSDTILAVKWKATDDDASAVFTCRVGDGVTYAGGTGVFTLVISANKTSTLPSSPARAVLTFELIYKASATDAYTLDSGTLYVEPSVLRTV
jgi:hypothetical protein